MIALDKTIKRKTKKKNGKPDFKKEGKGEKIKKTDMNLEAFHEAFEVWTVSNQLGFKVVGDEIDMMKRIPKAYKANPNAH